MTSTPVLVEIKGKESETRIAAPHGIGVGSGVLWIFGATAAWNGVFLAIRYVLIRLLGLG